MIEMKTKIVLDIASMIPDLDKAHEGDLLEVLEAELDEYNMSLEEFIVELAKIVNDLTA